MKKNTLAILLFLGVAHFAQAANILYFTPASDTVAVGGTVNLEVRLDSAVYFSAYQFDLLFDDTIFSSTSITQGTVFSEQFESEFFIPGVVSGGTIAGTASSMFGSGGINVTNGLLATFSFSALRAGTGIFSLDFIQLLDGDGLQMALEPSLTATVTVTPAGGGEVPEPSTYLLSLFGLGATALRARNRMRS